MWWKPLFFFPWMQFDHELVSPKLYSASLMAGLGGKRKLALPHGRVPHHPRHCSTVIGVGGSFGGRTGITQSTEGSKRHSARIFPNKKQGHHSLITLAGKGHQILCVLVWTQPLLRAKNMRFITCFEAGTLKLHLRMQLKIQNINQTRLLNLSWSVSSITGV